MWNIGKDIHCPFLAWDSCMVALKASLLCLFSPSGIFFFSSCFTGFIGSIGHCEPSLTNPDPSLFSLHRYNLPVGKRGGSCAIEIVVDNGTARHRQEYVSHPAPEVMRPACNQLNALSTNYVELASQSTVSFSLSKWKWDPEGLWFLFGLCDLGNHRLTIREIVALTAL